MFQNSQSHTKVFGRYNETKNANFVRYHLQKQLSSIYFCNLQANKLKVRSSRPNVFCEKDVLGNFTKFTRKHLRQSPFFNKVAGLRPDILLKKRLWHRYFPLNFAKFLRTTFLREHLRWLLQEL